MPAYSHVLVVLVKSCGVVPLAAAAAAMYSYSSAGIVGRRLSVGTTSNIGTTAARA